MSMDTSKFSLEETYKKLKPVKEHLSFTTLSDCLRTKRMFGSRLCSLLIWPRMVTAPLGVHENSMVYPVVFMRRMFFESADFYDVKGFTDAVLLCSRDNSVSEWLYMESKYAQRGGGIFWSEQTKLTGVNDQLFRKLEENPPASLPFDLSAGIVSWLELSSACRQKNVDNLGAVRTEFILRSPPSPV